MTNEELSVVKGGSKTVVLGVVGVIVSFVIGLFDGYYRPLSCNAR